MNKALHEQNKADVMTSMLFSLKSALPLSEPLRATPDQPIECHLDIDALDAVVLTHAHLDHSGYVPRLYQQGYRGPVYTHRATRDLCSILLPDSGHIQEEDARFFARHKLSKHEKPEPLYDRQTAERCMELFEPTSIG